MSSFLDSFFSDKEETSQRPKARVGLKPDECFATAKETAPKIFLKEGDLVFRGQEPTNPENLWRVTHIEGPRHLGRCLIYVERKGNPSETDTFKASTDLHRVDGAQPPSTGYYARFSPAPKQTALISRPITKPPPAS